VADGKPTQQPAPGCGRKFVQVQVAPVQSVPLTLPVQNRQLLDSLQAGELLAARVQTGAGGDLFLQIAGSAMKFPAPADMMPGSQVTLRVKENTGGKLQLAVVAPGSQNADAGSDEALSDLGMSAQETVLAETAPGDTRWLASDDHRPPDVPLSPRKFDASIAQTGAANYATEESSAEPLSAPQRFPATPAQIENASTPLISVLRDPHSTTPSGLMQAVRESSTFELSSPTRRENPSSFTSSNVATSFSTHDSATPLFPLPLREGVGGGVGRTSASASPSPSNAPLRENATVVAKSFAAEMGRPALNAPLLRLEAEFDLPRHDAPVAAALARAGLPVSPENLASLRQGLAEGVAKTPETLAWLRAANVEPTAKNTAALDSVLNPEAPKLGALIEKNNGEFPAPLKPLVVNPEKPPLEIGKVLSGVLENMSRAEAQISAKSAEHAGESAAPQQELATNLRGQMLLPAVQARADAVQPGLYFQLPCRVGEQWRTVEMRLNSRAPQSANTPAITDVTVRLETERSGTIEARMMAVDRTLALAFRFQSVDAQSRFQSAVEGLREKLNGQNVSCIAISCRVDADFEPLTQGGRLSVESRA